MADIKERPILFQTEMVKAILEGRKTQTRRIKGFTNQNPDEWEVQLIKGAPVSKSDCPQYAVYFKHKLYPNQTGAIQCPYGQPGDLLWVREAWNEAGRFESDFYANSEVNAYRTKDAYFFPNWKQLDTSHWNWDKIKWKPSIHMPKDAARIWLMIEDIRVERVQEISEEDAIAEGILCCETYGEIAWKRYDGDYTVTSKPKISFWSLWASINGEESWNSNPWVWVIQFRVLSTTGKPSEQIIENNYGSILRKEVNHV